MRGPGPGWVGPLGAKHFARQGQLDKAGRNPLPPHRRLRKSLQSHCKKDTKPTPNAARNRNRIRVFGSRSAPDLPHQSPVFLPRTQGRTADCMTPKPDRQNTGPACRLNSRLSSSTKLGTPFHNMSYLCPLSHQREMLKPDLHVLKTRFDRQKKPGLPTSPPNKLIRDIHSGGLETFVPHCMTA